MKTVFIPLVLPAMASAALANTAPTVVIQSAAMRPGTTLMDVVYRVNDPDDATVDGWEISNDGQIQLFCSSLNVPKRYFRVDCAS